MPIPKTAWDLLEATCKAIEASPIHYYQDVWAMRTEAVPSFTGESPPKGTEQARVCGTSYCRAGWMYTLASKKRPADSMVVTESCRWARELLERAGVPSYEISALFSGNSAEILNVFEPTKPHREPRWGTKAYARVGVSGIRKIMKKYEVGLKATKVTPATVKRR